MLRHDNSNKLNELILQYNGLFGTWQMLSHTLTWHFLCNVVKCEGLLSGMNVKYAVLLKACMPQITPDLSTLHMSAFLKKREPKMCSNYV